MRETLRKQTDSTKTDSTNNTNVLAYISVITRRRVWKYPTRYLSPFRSFLSSPHSFPFLHLSFKIIILDFLEIQIIPRMDATGNEVEKWGWEGRGGETRDKEKFYLNRFYAEIIIRIL